MSRILFFARRIAAILLAALLLAGTATAAAPAPDAAIPSVEDFGALPFLTNPLISPSGTHLAVRELVNGRPRVVITETAGSQKTVSSLAIGEKNDLEWYRWAGDKVLLVGVSASVNFFSLQFRATEILAYDLTTGKAQPIVVGKGIWGDELTYVDRAGKFILVTAQKELFGYPSVFRVDLETYAKTEIVKAQEGVGTWYADTSGVIRNGIGGNGEKWWVYYRRNEASPFRKSIGRPYTGDGNIDTLAVEPGSDRGYAVATGTSGRFGLYRYDFAADKLGELIYENPTADLLDYDLGQSGQLESVSYTDDRARILWFDPALKALQVKLERTLPGMSVRIVSASTDRMTLVIKAMSASNPGSYYLLDRKTSNMLVIAVPYDRLEGKRLADMESTSYVARDGLTIPAYLTLPPGRADKDLPLVIMPHGGPFARDEWGYDVWVQFLASRGYVVLQPNFRGSTGYGSEFVKRGDGQWGRGMQDDIDDGVKWLVSRGIVDPKRVCIMGASFGGYAAEWAAVRNPETYRCAISLAGVSDIAAQLAYDRKSFAAPRYFRNWRDRVLGNDGTKFDMISPYKHAAEIEIPLLLAHGDADTRVPPIQSKKLFDALTKLGRPPEYYVYKGEGHGFTKPEDQIDFLKKVEAFLAKHNPS